MILDSIIVGLIAWWITNILMDEKAPLGWYYDLLASSGWKWWITKPLGLCDVCFTGQLSLWFYIIKYGINIKIIIFIALSTLILKTIKRWT